MATEPEGPPGGVPQDEEQAVEQQVAVPAEEVVLRQAEAGADYEVTLESLSQWQLAWKKFRNHRLALIGIFILATFVLVAIVGPIFLPYSFLEIVRPDVRVFEGRPPSLTHPFGETGSLQRDVLTLVVNGARTSLLIGISSISSGSRSGRSSAPSPATSVASSTTS